jgi:hypothetical protein
VMSSFISSGPARMPFMSLSMFSLTALVLSSIMSFISSCPARVSCSISFWPALVSSFVVF